MVVTLKVLTDIYSKPDKKGKIKLIKKNVEYLRQFQTDMILVEQYLSVRGTPSKKWCFVKEGDTYYRVNHKFEEIKKLNEPIVVKGFR